MSLTLSPQDAWQPLPSSQWDADAARHLLRRACWSAQPEQVARALRDGLPATLERLFPAKPAALPVPVSVDKFYRDAQERRQRLRAAADPEKRELRREEREQARAALGDLAIDWMQFCAQPEHAAYEKWVSFLGNVYVVAADKVPDPALIYKHQATLRAFGAGPAPQLTKAVLRSPAMIIYLDLQQSRAGAPNENWARELMELFTLGVGHYTENDVKQGARAFTGYRQQAGRFRFARRQHDNGRKEFLGQSGDFDGDDIIDIIYRQPAAGTHLPARLTRWYLCDEPLPDAYLAALGAWWQSTGCDLRQLVLRYFSSRVFFDPQFRGAYIKSPQQYYLGLTQDLDLDLVPLPRRLLPVMRQMGQPLYFPPNVRGWVGGREWINSATLDARRSLVQTLFSPFNEDRLNADEKRVLDAAQAAGPRHYAVTNDRLAQILPLDDDAITARFVDFFLPVKVPPDYRAAITSFLSRGGDDGRKLARVRNAAITLLESPEYQLC